MAMEATHVRFALDLKDALEVRDIDAYVSGSVYPDSRYVSKVDRPATHSKEYRNDPFFKSNDFRKGWFAHLLCDDMQWQLMNEKLPETSEGTGGRGGESWVKRTAIKVLQDMDDVRKFDFAKHVPALVPREFPSGEPEEVLSLYYSLLRTQYAQTPNVGMEEEMGVWAGFNIGDDLLIQITQAAESYAGNEDVMSIVKTLYDAMLSRAKTTL